MPKKWGVVPAAVASALVAALGLGATSADAQANLVDLGVATGYGVNNSAQVVLRQGVYSNGTVTAFPTGFTGAAINANGEVAGTFTGAGNSGSAATWSNGTVTNLGVLPGADPSVDEAPALAINAGGQVVGYGCAGLGCPHVVGFINTSGVWVTLGALPPTPADNDILNQANGINDAGQVTGSAWKDNGQTSGDDAYVYDNGAWTDIGPGEGFAINASGQVTGVLATGPSSGSLNNVITGHAFIYTNGSVADLGTLSGGLTAAGYAINASGQIVGASAVSGSSATHAFFYNGVMSDLNSFVSVADPLKSFVTLADARGINDSGLIVVNGVDSRTQLTHAYLLQAPLIEIKPGTLTYPGQTIGTVSSAQTVTLTNAGSSAVPLNGISISGDFAQTNNCGASLAPGNGCAIMVTFGPTAGGDRTGSLTITSAGVPMVVALVGTAPIKATISSSASAVVTGVSVKLTWSASPGASCTATGGSTADGWTGNVALSGSQSVTESSPGTYQYGIACTAGSQSASNQVSVVVAWPIVTASLTAAPASLTSGQSTTLTWNSANATSCTATGGASRDGWTGSLATHGSQAVTEPFAPANPSVTLTYGITCTSSVSKLSAQASTKVVINQAPAKSGGGGGGALDLLSLVALLGALGWRPRPELNRRPTA